jgi:1-aminocyclopropane-1-carboxylate deaminase/D-cysteine desulfhydrase-like pyridoxal-dependent ACC family enzyme
MTNLSPVHEFNGVFVKREDIACWSDLDSPSGSKVRQYTAMVKKSPGVPCIVGCSSYSCQQVYVASAAHKAGVPGIIYVSARNELTDATKYVVRLGGEVNQVRPGYMNVVRARARARAKALGRVVQWDVSLALQDAMDQCANIPSSVKRIVIPTGSGLTASGVLAGLALMGHTASVLAVAVSGLADVDKIQQDAVKLIHEARLDRRRSFNNTDFELPEFELVNHPGKYGDFVIARLPDGTPLDPFYAAKAWQWCKDGDILWPVGLRPISSMPKACQLEFAEWKGPR